MKFYIYTVVANSSVMPKVKNVGQARDLADFGRLEPWGYAAYQKYQPILKH
jgi:hypothetical protein